MGSLTLHRNVEEYSSNNNLTGHIQPSSLSFRVGDGLCVLNTGEADVVCIAGMGVNTMISIFSHEKTSSVKLLDAIDCRTLVLQFTNSRPRNLISLYQILHQIGWEPCHERLVDVADRWYVTTSFSGRKVNPGSDVEPLPVENFPLSRVVSTPDNAVGYVQHHCFLVDGGKTTFRTAS